jgi:hypothetical protein
MGSFKLSIGLGIVTEALLCGTYFLGGGIGPCGGSSVSMAVLMVHLPGASLLEHLNLSNSLGLPGVLALYAAFWSLVWSGILALIGPGKSDR